mgnify:CR=1 FL=1
MCADSTGGVAGVLRGGVASGGVFQFAIDISSTEDIAKKIYTDLTTRTQSMYAGIAADPPDFDYDQAVTPVFPEVPDTDVPLLDDFYRAMADAAAYGDASRIANERYQGAVIDGDHEAAYLQAQATADFTRKFASSLRMLELLQSQVAAYDLTSTGLAFTPAENALGSQPYFYDDVDSDEPDGSDVTELWNEALADLEDMAANGLTQEQRDALKDCDATDVGHPGECLIDDALIDAALAQAQEPGFLTGLQAIDPQETIGEHLTAEHAFYADAIAQLNRFATWMTYNAMDEYRQTGAGAPNSAPVSSFTASAIAGEAPLTVEFTSMSKTYNMPGWRMGFAAGNPRLIAALARVKAYLDYGAFTPIQVAATAALNGPQDCIEEMRVLYKDRREVLVKGLRAAGWDVPAPEASMFVWAPIPERFRHLGSVGFSKLLLEKAKVAVAPGLGFGEHGDEHVRIALVENNHRIRQALRGIKTFLSGDNAAPVDAQQEALNA